MVTLSQSDGALVVSKLALLLRTLGNTMPAGATTSELSRLTAISRPTAHRLLSALAGQGFVDRNAKGTWLLGPELYVLGSVAAARYDITELAHQHIQSLADATGESAFFSIRRANETVCLLREDGSFPIRSFVLFEGKRFSLGVASAGLAILSFLPDEQIERYLSEASLENEFGESHSRDAILGRIQQTRETGVALNPGLVVEGSWGMAAAVFDPSGSPAWALSLTGIEARFSPQRQREMAPLLLRHAHQLTKQIAQMTHIGGVS